MTLINEEVHTHPRSDTRSGETGPRLPWEALLSPVKVRTTGESGQDPSQCPTCHTGASCRVLRCWHSNEKVNIEPRYGEWQSLGGKFLPGTSLAPPGSSRGRGPRGCWGKDGLGVGSVRVFSLSPLVEWGAFHSVLRSKPPARPPSVQHLAQRPDGASSTWVHTSHRGLGSPCRVPALRFCLHISTVKMSFLLIRK